MQIAGLCSRDFQYEINK